MTPQDHNRVLGIMHLIFGGFFALVTLMLFLIFGFIAVPLSNFPPEPNAPPMGFFIAIMAAVVVIYGVLSVPSIIAGYGMLKRRSWSRMAGIVAAILASVSFPFGTALCVYTLWFCFGEAGKSYDANSKGGEWRGALGGPPTSTFGWEGQRQGKRAEEYTPPPHPPSWRE